MLIGFLLVCTLGLTVTSSLSVFSKNQDYKYIGSLTTFCILLAMSFFSIVWFLISLIESRKNKGEDYEDLELSSVEDSVEETV